MKLFRMTAAAIALAACASISYADHHMGKNPIVGGKEMFPTKNIIQNAVNSADHTTLVAAVKAAGLVDTLQGPGPFTVFAPTNAAFAKLPAGTVDSLLKPDMKPTLTKVLTYHVVAGKWSADDLMKKIKDGNGTARARHRQRRQAVGDGQGRQGRPEGRKGRDVDGDADRRVPVQRRHPRGRHGGASELTAAFAGSRISSSLARTASAGIHGWASMASPSRPRWCTAGCAYAVIETTSLVIVALKRRSDWVAGPRTTPPVELKREPWHGHWKTPFSKAGDRALLVRARRSQHRDVRGVVADDEQLAEVRCRDHRRAATARERRAGHRQRGGAVDDGRVQRRQHRQRVTARVVGVVAASPTAGLQRRGDGAQRERLAGGETEVAARAESGTGVPSGSDSTSSARRASTGAPSTGETVAVRRVSMDSSLSFVSGR